MRNPKKVTLIIDLLDELVEKRGVDASTDKVGNLLHTALGNLIIARSEMGLSGTSSEDDDDEEFDDNEGEPHGSRDTFVPHPDGPDAERFNPLQD